MTDIRQGQPWDVYSDFERQWVRAVVMQVEDGEALLRYEGVLEFVRVPVDVLEQNPERFRPVPSTVSAC